MKLPDLQILPDDEKPESVRKWRIRQATVGCGSFALVVFYILPAMVGLPYPLPEKFGGRVAWASDQKGLQDKVNGIEVQLLTQSILNAHKEKCESEKAGRYTPYWQEQLASLRNKYWQLTGQTFELPPSC
jgi:hypothetical protein